MSMYSFYGGKQGRTYNLVAHYDSIKDMVDLFQKGGSYVDANYNEYVIIDTLINKNEKYNRENGIIFRRDLNYSEPFNEQPIPGYYVNSNHTITENDTESTILVADALDVVYQDYEAPTTGEYNVSAQVPKYKHYEYKISEVDGVPVADVRFKELKRENDRETKTLYGEANVMYTDETIPEEGGGTLLSWNGLVPKYTHYSYVLVDNAGTTNVIITPLKDQNNAPLTIFAKVWNAFVLNPGGGAAYVGQIVGPEGDSPEIDLIDWASFKDEYISSVDAAKGEITATRQPGFVENEGYYDNIQYGYCNIRDAQGNIVGATISFDFPYTIFNYTAESVSAYGPDVIEVQTLPSSRPENPKAYYKYENKYYLWDETRKTIDSTTYPITYIDDPGFVETEIWAAEPDGNGGFNYTNMMREYADSQGHSFYKDYQMFIPRGIHGVDFVGCAVANDFELTYTLRDYSQTEAGRETEYSLGHLKVIETINPNITTDPEVQVQDRQSFLVVTYYNNETQDIPIPTIQGFTLNQGKLIAEYYSGTQRTTAEIGTIEYVNDINFTNDQYLKLTYNTYNDVGQVKTKTLDVQIANVIETYIGNDNPISATEDYHKETRLDEVKYWYNKYDVIPDGQSSTDIRVSETPINSIVAIRNVGDTLAILYSDPEYRQNLAPSQYQLLVPTEEELRIKENDQGGWISWTYTKDDTNSSVSTGGKFRWTLIGSIFTSNHLFGNFVNEATLKATKPYGFGYDNQGHPVNTETHAIGWVTSVGDTSQSTTLTIYGYNYSKPYSIDDTDRFIFDNEGNITSPLQSVAENNWYAISSFETAGLDPSQAVIQDKANAGGTPSSSTKSANLQNKGFWFEIFDIPVAKEYPIAEE